MGRLMVELSGMSSWPPGLRLPSEPGRDYLRDLPKIPNILAWINWCALTPGYLASAPIIATMLHCPLPAHPSFLFQLSFCFFLCRKWIHNFFIEEVPAVCFPTCVSEVPNSMAFSGCVTDKGTYRDQGQVDTVARKGF